MSIDQHAAEFAGKAVRDYEPGQGLADLSHTVYRIGYGYEAFDATEPLTNRIAGYLKEPGAEETTGIVIGTWREVGAGSDEAGSIVEALVAARDRLPKLTALFLGDIIQEESEISWIVQADMAPLFQAYPRLTHFRVRGSQGLVLGRLRHDSLRSLVIESGGLSAAVVRDVAAAQLPSLEHLELWLGTDDYGGDATVHDLQPILAGAGLPALRYLGLRDSKIADEVAQAVATAPLLARLEVLDLSLGTLTDVGAAALLGSLSVPKLKTLDLHYHYLSDEMMAKMRGLGIEVDVKDQQQPDEHRGELYRYPAVTE